MSLDFRYLLAFVVFSLAKVWNFLFFLFNFDHRLVSPLGVNGRSYYIRKTFSKEQTPTLFCKISEPKTICLTAESGVFVGVTGTTTDIAQTSVMHMIFKICNDMKQLKLSIILTVLMSMAGVTLFAKEDTTFEVNGIYYYNYDYNDNVMVVNNCQGVHYTEFVNNYQGDIVIPEKVIYKGETYNVTRIGSQAFFRAYYVTSVKIPNSVTIIENEAFAESGLTSIEFPNSVTSIGSYAFYGVGLTTITMNCQIPPLIQDDTFNNYSVTLYVPFACKNAYLLANYWKNFKEIVEIAPSSQSIEFADANVKEICVENWDVDGDGELSEIEAAAVTDLGTVFSGNKDIQSFVELKNFIALKSIKPHAFSGCTNLVSIEIPYSITSIEEYAFYNCSSLIKADIPNSVTYIGHFAFYGTGLTNVTIPVTDLAFFLQ